MLYHDGLRISMPKLPATAQNFGHPLLIIPTFRCYLCYTTKFLTAIQSQARSRLYRMFTDVSLNLVNAPIVHLSVYKYTYLYFNDSNEVSWTRLVENKECY